MTKFFKRIHYSLSLMLLGLVFAFNTGHVAYAQQPNQTLALRVIQSRLYKTTDIPKMMQNIASTLQDMGYIIGRIDNNIGFINATRFADDITEITVTIQPLPNEMIVRASARRNNIPMDNDPFFYQLFFNHLSQAAFLNANSIY